MRITARTVTVNAARTFTIARGSSDSFDLVQLSLETEGFTGRGEGAPNDYYGQDAPAVTSALEDVVIDDPWDIEGTLTANSHLPPTALCALDGALNDLAAKRLGVPLYRLLGLAKPNPVSAFTLGIDDPEKTVAEAERLAGRPVFKMKVGGWRDIETVRMVREASEARLWVDANEAFSPGDAVEVVRELRGIGVEMIEQPVPASGGPESLRTVTEAAYPVPVIADESSVTAADIPPLAGCVSGVNVKLAKCGGVRNALGMVHTARAHGMKVMLGCMVESSLGIAPAAHISGLFDFVDLDGAELLADDPFHGTGYRSDGRIEVLDEPGLGVSPKEDA